MMLIQFKIIIFKFYFIFSGYSETSCFSTSGSSPSQPLPPVLKQDFINKLSLEWQSRPNDDNYTLQMEDEGTVS